MERPGGTRAARVIQVIETKEIKGAGTEKDPVREVIQYWDLDGKRLATSDPNLAYENIESEYENVKESLI
ncbi:MAG: carboxypeptidase [Enterocloster asparagiformis]|nr:carboxypeptidase [Enterocloster asparagiformis]